jgi:hypothetical protein
MLKIVLVAAAIGLLSAQKTLEITDLCKTELCGGKHITCELQQIQEKAASGCARILDLTDENKQAFVDAHNKKRNLIAGGEQPGFNSATRMATVVSTSDVLLELNNHLNKLLGMGPNIS